MTSISSIKWTSVSVEHIARYGIDPDEVEEACFNEDDIPLIRSGKQNLHYVFGKSYAGRLLFIVVRFLRPGEVTLITARDMNYWEKNYFKRQGK